MIISRTPLRISLGGGGTDLPFYYEKHGGFVLSATVSKYLYIIISNHFDDVIQLNYSTTEICKTFKEIKHPIVRESLKLFGIKNHISIASFADLPARTGLGSSGSFSVGLLNALNSFLGLDTSKRKLAELACKIEMDILKNPVGKQDQYASSFGGFSCIDIKKNGSVSISPLKIKPNSIHELENNLSFFYTGITRSATNVIQDQKNNSTSSESIESLTNINNIGKNIKKYLENDELDNFGYLMNEHWNEKKKTSKLISNEVFDKYYSIAKQNGSLGGKIIGAGGGGFFMFYTNSQKNKNQLRKEFIKRGLREVKLSFEPEGTKIVFNIGGKHS